MDFHILLRLVYLFNYVINTYHSFETLLGSHLYDVLTHLNPVYIQATYRIVILFTQESFIVSLPLSPRLYLFHSKIDTSHFDLLHVAPLIIPSIVLKCTVTTQL